jgi:hypothetical protein
LPRTWEVAQTTAFRESLPWGNEELLAALGAMQKRVQADPLIGNPKTGRYKHFRSIHVKDHWVLAWYLEPPVLHREHLHKLEVVVFAFFGHHDEWD